MKLSFKDLNPVYFFFSKKKKKKIPVLPFHFTKTYTIKRIFT